MEEMTRRDYFAAFADVGWMNGATADFITLKTGVNHPPEPMTDAQKALFYTRAQIAWRWRYADLMVKGSES